MVATVLLGTSRTIVKGDNVIKFATWINISPPINLVLDTSSTHHLELMKYNYLKLTSMHRAQSETGRNEIQVSHLKCETSTWGSMRQCTWSREIYRAMWGAQLPGLGTSAQSYASQATGELQSQRVRDVARNFPTQ